MVKWCGNALLISWRQYEDVADKTFDQAIEADPFGAAHGGEGEGRTEAEKAAHSVARQAAHAVQKEAAHEAAQSTPIHCGNKRQNEKNPLQDCEILPNAANVRPRGTRT